MVTRGNGGSDYRLDITCHALKGGVTGSHTCVHAMVAKHLMHAGTTYNIDRESIFTHRLCIRTTIIV